MGPPCPCWLTICTDLFGSHWSEHQRCHPAMGSNGEVRKCDAPRYSFCIKKCEQNPPTPALAKAGAAPGTTSGVELVFLSNNNPKARSMVSSQRGPRQQAPQGHNNGFLGFLWASKPAVCQPLNPKTPKALKTPKTLKAVKTLPQRMGRPTAQLKTVKTLSKRMGCPTAQA